MPPVLTELFPILYGACFLLLLVQAFRTMARGFRAVPRPGDPSAADPAPETDRTGRLTVHPELLDADGHLTSEDLLTVRFGTDNDSPSSTGDSP